MSDHIVVRGLRVVTRIGATAEERGRPQQVLIDIDAVYDASIPSRSDDLDDTIDYGALVHDVAALVAASEAALLERLAGEVAELVCERRGVERVTVAVGKEVPPIPEEVGAVTVIVDRPGKEQ